MKKRIKNAFKNPMLIVLALIIIIFTPQAIYSPGQNRDVGVVVGIGVDKQDDEFEISL